MKLEFVVLTKAQTPVVQMLPVTVARRADRPDEAFRGTRLASHRGRALLSFALPL